MGQLLKCMTEWSGCWRPAHVGRHLGYRLLFVGWLLAPVSAWPSETGLRIAFVYNFLKFIEWPALSDGAPVNLCVFQARHELRELLKDISRRQHPRPIQVFFLDDVNQVNSTLSGCHLAYMPLTGEEIPLPEELPPGVVLVADEAPLSDGRIAIILQRNAESRIEFLINTQAINHAGVSVSSQLLKLAKNHKGANG